VAPKSPAQSTDTPPTKKVTTKKAPAAKTAANKAPAKKAPATKALPEQTKPRPIAEPDRSAIGSNRERRFTSESSRSLAQKR
jgi:hypothetical protein